MTILDKISNNEISTLKITMEAEDVFHNDGSVHDFLDTLQRNTSIDSVRLEGEFLGCLRADARSKVLQEVGDSLGSALREVTLGDSLVLVSDVAHILTKSPALRTLNLHDVVLQGDEDCFRALEAALMQHPSLKEFEMGENCYSAVQEIDLDRVMNAKKAGCISMPTPAVNVSAIAKSA
jgi:hypothetical protein